MYSVIIEFLKVSNKCYVPSLSQMMVTNITETVLKYMPLDEEKYINGHQWSKNNEKIPNICLDIMG
jgi:hypothetical protein